MSFLSAFSRFFQEFAVALPALLPLWAAAWLGCFVVLVLSLRTVKSYIRPHVRRFDETVTQWARSLRYRFPVDPEKHPASPVAPPTPVEKPSERVPLTWFFRFWTNFGSSPSIGALSLLVAILAFWAPESRIEEPGWTVMASARWWFLPGLAFTGGMWLSWVTKRIFKRLRPDRGEGAFGHKLRDPSFPSGHSLTGVCFWSMIVVSLLHTGATLAAVVALGVLGLTITLLTGLSRVYLGVHFPSDVTGGYFIGLVWSFACYLALRVVL